MHLTLAHTPDSDDAFMFYGLAEGQVDTRGHTFEHVLHDIQSLNEMAYKEVYDITAVSMYAYAAVADRYALLPTGASMGDGYGPRLVGKRAYSQEELKKLCIAIPGRKTSAFLALQLYLNTPGDALNLVVVPFDQIFNALEGGKADVGLLIHEGQLTYLDRGLTLSKDLGQWWHESTGGLPLPLGTNVVRRALGAEVMRDVACVLQESILYGLQHRKASVRASMAYGRGLDEARTDQFIGMYVNELTIDYGERGRAGVREFLKRGADMGLVPRMEIEFVETGLPLPKITLPNVDSTARTQEATAH